MNDQLKAVMIAMIKHDAHSPKRIQHFMKVHEIASLIGQMEGLDDETQFILETAAIVHDIGIKIADEKYGAHPGPKQEQEGMVLVKPLLEEVGGYTPAQIERITYLVGHHHTYTNVTGIDYRILLEADLLVNLYESEVRYKKILKAENKIFQTPSGIWLLEQMFNYD
ncbi:MAG: HD domain-containing protein [Erysipelotrichaceae bacterium]|nr:HD domain-containing protein [Erysipelotrichaceae bacterium]